jgi:glycosyltransferase involved in cell wall biosynthesis
MHDSPAVSVILPTYNRAPLLMRAIASVLGQEFRDLELIVVDDGSTDETAQVVSKVGDARLRYIHLGENRGETFARNAGIRQARGDLIAQMDADDIWYPQKTSYQVDLFNRYGHLDLIFCNMFNINHVNGSEGVYFTQTAYAFRLLQVRELEGGVWEILGGLPEALLVSTIIPHPTVMLRRPVLEMIGIYDESLRGSGDFEYWWRAALRGVKFAYTTQVFLIKHTDVQSLTSDKLNRHMRHLQALKICEQSARDLERTDLLVQIRYGRFASWCRILFEHVVHAEYKAAFAAFLQCQKHGSLLDLLLFACQIMVRRAKERANKILPRSKNQLA